MNNAAIQHLEISEAVNSSRIPVTSPRLTAVKEAPQRRFYRPELDVLRFVAFLAVFLHHGLPGFEIAHHHGFAARLALWETVFKEAGRFGVCLFFTLSAYLITELLCREANETGNVHVAAFYLRRILRIWPLYFAFLFLGVLVGWFFRDYYVEPSRLWAFLFLSGNWYVVASGCSASPIAPLWSISVEEQFYLIWPWVARLGGKKFIGVISLFLVPVSILFIYRLSWRGVDASHVIWVNSFVQFQFFALGSLLALGLRGRVPALKPFVRIAMASLALAASLAAASLLQTKDFIAARSPLTTIAGYECIALGCILALCSVLGLSKRWLPTPLIYLGKISYGLYVFHMLSLDVAWKLFWPAEGERSLLQMQSSTFLLGARAGLLLLVGLGTTIGLALLSYRFLERRFLNVKQRFTFIPSRSV